MLTPPEKVLMSYKVSYTEQDKLDLDLFFQLIKDKQTSDPQGRHWICQKCPQGWIYDWSVKVCEICGLWKIEQ